jgi:hypothetical protein
MHVSSPPQIDLADFQQRSDWSPVPSVVVISLEANSPFGTNIRWGFEFPLGGHDAKGKCRPDGKAVHTGKVTAPRKARRSTPDPENAA